MGTVLAFPKPRKRRRSAALPLFPADIQPYPLTRYAGGVDCLARHMRSLSTLERRSDAMIRHVTIEWNRLTELGVSEKLAGKSVVQFADAVWSEVDRIERGGVA